MFVMIPLALCFVLTGAPVQRKTPARQAQAGLDALNAGRAQEAAVAFDEALRGAPREPSVLLGAGVAAHLLSQPDAVRRYLSEALKHEPAMTAASLLLGETFYRANDLAAAIDVYEKALVHAPAHRQLNDRLEEWRKEAALAPRGVPVWLNEGLAMVFDGTDVEARSAEVRAVEARIPLASLEGSFERLDTASATVAYALSGIATSLLVREIGAPNVVTILTDIGRGIAFAAAFERHANMSYADFQRKLASN